MIISRRWIGLLLLTAAMAGGACASIFTAGELRVTAAADDTVVSPTHPATVHVTAKNVGDARVTWGPGSSTCQLHLFVRVDGRDLFAPVDRLCTADLRTLGLDPGESRTETLEWTGLVQQGDSVVSLDPGTYALRAAAAGAAMSEPILVEIYPVLQRCVAFMDCLESELPGGQ